MQTGKLQTLRALSSSVLAVASLCAAFTVGCNKRAAQDEPPPTSATEGLTSTKGNGLVISQVYGGTGAETAAFNRDYVELFNKTSEPIPLKGLAIHFAASVGDFVPIATLPDTAVVPPGGYYLVGFAAGLWGNDLKVDFGGSATNILPVNGKIALVRVAEVDAETAADAGAAAQAQLLRCGSPDAGSCVNGNNPNGRVIDLVGFGASSDFEGDKPAAPAAVAKSVIRRGNGCTDTGNNASDFEAAAPKPRSSKSPTQPCGGT
jgi:hypothetical protein